MTQFLTRELLESAAAVVKERGLCQLAYTELGGAVCILGAVAIARGYPLCADSSFDDGSLDDFIEEPLGELSVLMGRDPVAFSDDKGRTADEVADALLDAARRLAS